MKRLALAGALGLLATLAGGHAYAQMDSLGSTGLGDARAQNLPTSVGINNGYGGHPSYGYAAPGYGYAAGPELYRGRSVYAPRHRHRYHGRHW
jgi:hypothetical protein